MKKKYLHREAEKQLERAAKQFPAILLTGPRQAGKSTLLMHQFKGYSWASLDDLDVRAKAINDPEYFFSLYPPPVIIDEIQYAPDLLSYIKLRIDKNRDLKGQFVLTGSQTFQVMKGVSESLAGRIAIFDLLPLTWKELLGERSMPEGSKGDALVLEKMLSGFYPELAVDPEISVSDWYKSYIRTYIERDVRDIKAITNLHDFQIFLKLLAPRAGQLLNLSEVNKEAGISFSTAKDWLSILESTYIVRLVQPYHSNHTKRLVKTPKLYFTDTGLLCNLLNISTPDQLQGSPFLGAIFENMCVMETIKSIQYLDVPVDVYFYRNTQKQEVDLLLKSANEMHAYEIKFCKSIKPAMTEGLNVLKKDFANAKLHLVSLSEKGIGFRDIESLHWSQLPGTIPRG